MLTVYTRGIYHLQVKTGNSGFPVWFRAIRLGGFRKYVAVIFISKYGIAVFRVQAVCRKFKFHLAVVGEISLCRGDLLLFHDKRIQILKGLRG